MHSTCGSSRLQRSRTTSFLPRIARCKFAAFRRLPHNSGCHNSLINGTLSGFTLINESVLKEPAPQRGTSLVASGVRIYLTAPLDTSAQAQCRAHSVWRKRRGGLVHVCAIEMRKIWATRRLYQLSSDITATSSSSLNNFFFLFCVIRFGCK